MRTLIDWLRRLESLTSDNAQISLFRIFFPGNAFLDVDRGLFTTEQPREVPPGFKHGLPEVAALLACPDERNPLGTVLPVRHRFSSELAAAMSIALDRRIDIPNELCVGVEGRHTKTFLPLGVLVDRVITGPMPQDAIAEIEATLSQILGLNDDDVDTIGAAATMLHGALLTFDRDVRAAYSLLVFGIEILSRRYGDRPSDWQSFEKGSRWDALFVALGLSPAQAEAVRAELTKDNLLLRATFRSYASQRLRESFWKRSWTEWHYPLDVRDDSSSYREPEVLHEGSVEDFLPRDRTALSALLGRSYDLRSEYVHRGRWFGPMDQSLNPAAMLSPGQPLPFPVLRAVLRELILTELAERGTAAALPPACFERGWQPG